MALDDLIVLFDTSRGMNLAMRGDRGYGGMGWYLRLLPHPFRGTRVFGLRELPRSPRWLSS